MWKPVSRSRALGKSGRIWPLYTTQTRFELCLPRGCFWNCFEPSCNTQWFRGILNYFRERSATIRIDWPPNTLAIDGRAKKFDGWLLRASRDQMRDRTICIPRTCCNMQRRGGTSWNQMYPQMNPFTQQRHVNYLTKGITSQSLVRWDSRPCICARKYDSGNEVSCKRFSDSTNQFPSPRPPPLSTERLFDHERRYCIEWSTDFRSGALLSPDRRHYTIRVQERNPGRERERKSLLILRNATR